jgi:hypothetical protein
MGGEIFAIIDKTLVLHLGVYNEAVRSVASSCANYPARSGRKPQNDRPFEELREKYLPNWS